MRRGIILLLMITGFVPLLIPSIEAGTSTPPADFPSCDSFGVQRFQERKEAPPFTLKTLDGNRISLSDFRGKPVIITFWATWCDSCRENIPLMEKFSMGKRDQIAFLLIAIDGERKRTVQEIVDENKINLPVLLLLKEKVMDHYAVRGWVPLSFLVNQEGILLGKIVGPRDWCSPEAWSCMKELFSLR